MPSKRIATDESNHYSAPKLQKSSSHSQLHPAFASYTDTSTAGYVPAVQQQQQQQPQQQPQIQHQTAQQVTPTTPAAPGPGSAKKRTTGTSSRTGQACDRCKARKIRCDDTPGGCMPCRQNHTECTTTDRITNRPQVRGHTEAIEQEAAILRQQVAELQAQLKENSIEPRVSSFPLQQSQSWPQSAQAAAGQALNVSSGPQDQNGNAFATADDFNSMVLPHEANLFAQTFTASGVHSSSSRYVGMSSGHADTSISPATGLSLSVFGAKVDLAELVPQETHKKLHATSWDGIFKYISRGYTEHPNHPPPNAKLPSSRDECEQQCRIYLSLINAYLPILDKRDFMDLVRKFYTNSFRPSAAEKVMLHMVLCMIKFHMCSRNTDGWHANKDLETQYRAHLEFALQHVPQLVSHRALADVQALALILMQLRNHPTPHACYFLTHWVSGIILDMRLHRSATSRAMDGITMSQKECEMRKRVFWSIMGVLVTVSGKLGRPIELRSEDIDIELPEPYEDLLKGETASCPERRCSFTIGIESFKLLLLFQDIYNNLYSVKPFGDYETTLKSIQARLRAWRERLPAAFRLNTPQGEDHENRMFALWLAYWDAEIQLLLHHPAVCRSVNPQIVSANIQQSVDASYRIIELVAELRKAKSHDTSWLSASTYIAAVFTLLFAFRQQMEDISPNEIAKLQAHLDVCYAALEDVGVPLGTGRNLPDSVQRTVNPILREIKAYVENKHGISISNAADQSRQAADNAAMQRHQAAQALHSNIHGAQPHPYSPHQSQNQEHPSAASHNIPYSQQQSLPTHSQLQQQTPAQTSYPIHQHQHQQQQPHDANHQPSQYPQQQQQQQLHFDPQSATSFMPYQPSSNYGRPFQGAGSNPAHAHAQQQAYLNHLNTVLAWNDMPVSASTSTSNGTTAATSNPQQWMQASYPQGIKSENPASAQWQATHAHTHTPPQGHQPPPPPPNAHANAHHAPAQAQEQGQAQGQQHHQRQQQQQQQQQEYMDNANLMGLQGPDQGGVSGYQSQAQPWPMATGFIAGGMQNGMGNGA